MYVGGVLNENLWLFYTSINLRMIIRRKLMENRVCIELLTRTCILGRG